NNTNAPPNPITEGQSNRRPGQGGRCLSRPKFEVNHVLQGLAEAFQWSENRRKILCPERVFDAPT
ncbi:hypothetical protein, partial [Maricaulis sp. W15]|uniref:hypothetical protein n=1 Tax=Maricaulis sp. W15 TaxID=1772333 RepID=UPI001E62485F